jgi:hypothetical protein
MKIEIQWLSELLLESLKEINIIGTLKVNLWYPHNGKIACREECKD